MRAASGAPGNNLHHLRRALLTVGAFDLACSPDPPLDHGKPGAIDGGGHDVAI